MRAVLPEELETARLIIAEKQRIIKEACGQADEYLEQSRERVSRMIDENEITRNAMKMSEEILAKAEEVAKEIRAEANEYAENLLNHMERVLKKALKISVREKKSFVWKCSVSLNHSSARRYITRHRPGARIKPYSKVTSARQVWCKRDWAEVQGWIPGMMRQPSIYILSWLWLPRLRTAAGGL